MSTDPHTQRVRGLAHAWLLVGTTMRAAFVHWHHLTVAVPCGNALTTRCDYYLDAVGRYGAGPR